MLYSIKLGPKNISGKKLASANDNLLGRYCWWIAVGHALPNLPKFQLSTVDFLREKIFTNFMNQLPFVKVLPFKFLLNILSRVLLMICNNS